MFAGQFKGKSTYGPGGDLENELIFTTVDGLMWQSTERPSGQVTDYIYDDRGTSHHLQCVVYTHRFMAIPVPLPIFV